MWHFDTSVDVLCIGTGLAPMAAAIAAADAGKVVLVAKLPRGQAQWRTGAAKPPRSWAMALRSALSVDGLSGETMEYLVSLTNDVAPPDLSPLSRSLSQRHVGGSWKPSDAVAPFRGRELLTWNQTCLNSPYGVLYTQISLPGAREFVQPSGARVEVSAIARPPNDQLVTSPSAWLASQARRRGVGLVTAGSLHRLVFEEDGQVVGAVFGERSIRVRDGVLLGAGPRKSDDSALRETWRTPGGQLGLASAVASRFGRLEVLTNGTAPTPDTKAAGRSNTAARSRV